ncbi:hypothetical protein AM493_11710 [Flavobacterium akiainvivens]|uniref:Uncharacterized protein n=1 Tax=Flavobacterium akiainvivens TaxID=1202724 RepID=A0A0M8M9W7_9FLAO|nr:hypothetical protein [Flavobacterium akiainvivens]KOS06623.1 hypothetical protein AM493_11710 [Flavobacterium akiainvivens]SFQ08858.1 hypothetical protein SAMN05444144_10117 [Flavobacterium akiainvivens]
MKTTGVLLLLLLFTQAAFSQQIDMEKDTIQMQGLEIVKSSKKLKVKTLKLDGPCYYAENMRNAEEIITLADKLPAGTLQSVSFYFNDTYTNSKQKEKFKDTEFELVLYTVTEDDTPGSAIEHDPVIVKVGKAFSGKLIVDLSAQVLECPERLFAGLKRITPADGNDTFFIDCLCSGHDKYMTLTRKAANASWERRWQCAALKAEVNVGVHR